MSWLVQVNSPMPFIGAALAAVAVSFLVTMRQPRR
jgi:hypothetical protein